MRWLFLILLFPVSCFGQIMTSGGGVDEAEAPPGGTAYYVKSGGNDASNGLTDGTAWEHHPWMSTYTGGTTLVAGDVVYMNRGDTWTIASPAAPYMSIGQDGSSGNYITTTAYGTGAKPIINISTNTAQPVIYGVGKSFIKFNNLDITHNKSSYSYAGDGILKSGIYLGDDGGGNVSHDWVITNCDIHDIPFAGIWCDTNAYNIVVGDTTATGTATTSSYSNHIYDIGNSGVVLMGSNPSDNLSNFKVYYNYIHNIRDNPVDLDLNATSYGIKLTAEAGSNSHPQYVYARYNRVDTVTTWTAIDSHGGTFVYIQDNDVHESYNHIGAQAAVIGSLTTVLDSCFIERNTLISSGSASDTNTYFIHLSGENASYPATNGFIRDNTMYYTSRSGSVLGAYAISVEIVDTVTVSGNYAYDGPTTTFRAFNLNDVDRFTINNNRVDDWWQGMYFQSSTFADTSKIYNNLFNTTGRGVYTFNTLASGCDLSIYNNIFVVQTAERILELLSINVGSGSSLTLKNNIVAFSPSTAAAQYISTPSTINGTFDIDNTLYHNSTHATPFNIGGALWYTWAQYQANTSYDDSAPTPADPLFVDSPTSLRVFNTSDAIDGGVAISGYTADYEEVAVGSPPNIGAYETDGGAPPTEEADYYIDPDGDDGGAGSISDPWFTLTKVWTVLAAGDKVYCRGGTYNYTSPQTLTGVNGTSADTIKIYNYPGEEPVFTKSGSFSPPASHMGLIDFQGDYFHWKGLSIKDFTQENTYIWWGMRVRNAEENVFEQLKIYDSGGGIHIRGDIGTTKNNKILNGDFYKNSDPLTSPAYDNADGIQIGYIAAGDTNYVEGCRLWWNSDDGMDFWNNNGYVHVTNTWAWYNGFLKDTYTKSSFGIGFKLGQQTAGDANDITRYFSNCIAWMNSECGWSENMSLTQTIMYNNIAYRNGLIDGTWGSGFEFWNSSIPHVLKNNISYGNNDNEDVGDDSNESNNSWNAGVTISDADFISLDTTLFYADRLSDGSLPHIAFGHLTEGSDAIDAGTDVGITYQGSDPDVGAFEYNPITDGLVSYFKMDETSGSTMEDDYSNNDGTIVGATIANSNAILETAYDFDGTNDTINLGTDSDFRFTTSMSISMWVDADATVSASLVDNYHAGNAEGYFVHISGNIVEFWAEGASQESVYGSTSLSGAGWTHVVVTYDGSALRVYIDGSSDATPVSYSGTITYSSSCVIGGGGKDSSHSHFDGQIDEIGFWDEALSAAEVTELYNSGAAKRHPFE